jgi:hypothetical protein
MRDELGGDLTLTLKNRMNNFCWESALIYAIGNGQRLAIELCNCEVSKIGS